MTRLPSSCPPPSARSRKMEPRSCRVAERVSGRVATSCEASHRARAFTARSQMRDGKAKISRECVNQRRETKSYSTDFYYPTSRRGACASSYIERLGTHHLRPALSGLIKAATIWVATRPDPQCGGQMPTEPSWTPRRSHTSSLAFAAWVALILSGFALLAFALGIVRHGIFRVGAETALRQVM